MCLLIDRCFSLFLKGVDPNNDNNTAAHTGAEAKTSSLDKEKETSTGANVSEDIVTVGDLNDDTSAVNSPQSTGNADEETCDNLSVCAIVLSPYAMGFVAYRYIYWMFVCI